jgi:hypothetical protein
MSEHNTARQDSKQLQRFRQLLSTITVHQLPINMHKIILFCYGARLINTFSHNFPLHLLLVLFSDPQSECPIFSYYFSCSTDCTYGLYRHFLPRFLASALCASLASKVSTAFESYKVYEASLYYQQGIMCALLAFGHCCPPRVRHNHNRSANMPRNGHF